MAHWQMDNKEQAREWHNKAIAWRDTNTPDDELQGFYTEAAKRIGPDMKDAPELTVQE